MQTGRVIGDGHPAVVDYSRKRRRFLALDFCVIGMDAEERYKSDGQNRSEREGEPQCTHACATRVSFQSRCCEQCGRNRNSDCVTPVSVMHLVYLEISVSDRGFQARNRDRFRLCVAFLNAMRMRSATPQPQAARWPPTHRCRLASRYRSRTTLRLRPEEWTQPSGSDVPRTV